MGFTRSYGRVLPVAVVLALVVSLLPATAAQAPEARAEDPGGASGEVGYVYDALGRLAAVVEQGGETAVYTYDAAGNVTAIHRHSSSDLTVIETIPRRGVPGSTVRVYGTGFAPEAGNNEVRFGGVAAEITEATATELVVVVPAGATTGLVEVLTPSGTASNSAAFTVVAEPQITALVPDTGAAGDVVTVAGSGFDADLTANKVRLNSLMATVVGGSEDELEIVVPERPTSGRVAVTTPDGTATSEQYFYTPPHPYSTEDIAFYEHATPGGDEATGTIPSGQVGVFLFEGVQGQRVSFNFTRSPSGCVTYQLRTPGGGQLFSTMQCGTSGFRDRVTLPEEGTYSLVVNPSGDWTGTAGVLVHDVPDDVEVTAAPGGEAVSVEITTPGQRGNVLFEAVAGQRVSFNLTRSPSGCVTYQLRDPSDTQLFSVLQCGTSGFQDRLTLPDDGTYRLHVNPSGDWTGNAGVLVHDVPDDVEVTAAPGGDAVSVEITTPGQRGNVLFEAVAGQRVSFNLTRSPSGCVTYQLRDPSDTQLFSVLQCGTSGFQDRLTLPDDGTYRLHVNPSGDWTGTAGVLVHDVPDDVEVTAAPGGDAVSVEITTPGQRGDVLFEADAGQRVSFDFTRSPSGCVTYQLRDPADQQLFSQLQCGTSGSINDHTLPDEGTYRLHLNPSGDWTGTAGVLVHDVPDDGQVIAEPGGDPVTVVVSTPGQGADVLFAAVAGQRVSFNFTRSPSGCVTYQLRDPADQQLFSVLQCGTSGFRDRLTLPADGTYVLRLIPSGSWTGQLGIQIHDVPDDVELVAVPGGEAVSVGITTPGQRGDVLFEAVAGQRVSFNFTRSPSGCVTYQLRDPADEQLFSVLQCGTSGFRDRLTLPDDGTYRLHVNPSGDWTGNAGVLVHDVPEDVELIAVPGGEAVSVEITTPGQRGNVLFEAVAGQRVSFNFTRSPSGCVTYQLRDPADQQLFSVLQCGTSGFRDRLTLPDDGTYRLHVNPSGDWTGTAGVEVHDVPDDLQVNAVVGGDPVNLAISTPGQRGSVLFEGTADSKVSFSLTRSPSGCVTYQLRTPSDTQLFSILQCGTSGSINDRTLPENGAYTLLANPSGDWTGNLGVTVIDAGPAGLALDPAEFMPASASSSPEPAAQWLPGAEALAGDWRSHQPDSEWESVQPLYADDDVTALSGQVLDLKGDPLRGATLRLQGREARTDASGRFLLTGVAAGHHVLEIDGDTAGPPGHRYGFYEVGVMIYEGGTNLLPFTIWLPRLSRARTTRVSSPTRTEVVVTTPHIPGLEVHIPAGTEIVDSRGNPVTEISITPIPVDRTPFPLPAGVEVPVYFTIQPGGARLSQPARIVYPNYTGEDPGTPATFWHYRPHHSMEEHYRGGGWHIYGQGEVTGDGSRIVPGPGVGIREFTGAMINVPGLVPPGLGPLLDALFGGDPVDLYTGLFVYEQDDLLLDDTIPLQLTRTYRPLDVRRRAFGIGTTHAYDMFMWSAQQYQVADLVLPTGGRVNYVRTSPGTGFTTAEFAQVGGTAGAFTGSTIKWNGDEWDLRLRDGTVYVIGENAPLQSISDRYGNTVRITRRDVNVFGSGIGPITRVTSPSGRWIAFEYDSEDRVVAARDNAGRVVTYTYDGEGRLVKVIDAAGGETTYTYDSEHRMLTVTDARGVTFVSNTYDAKGRVVSQQLAGGGGSPPTYEFAYVEDGQGNVVRTDVTDPLGVVRSVEFDADARSVADTTAAGTADEITVTWERDAETKLPLRITDPAGRNTDFTYDADGNILSVTELAGTAGAVTASFTYEPVRGDVTSVTDETGNTTAFVYDSAGRLTKVVDPLGGEGTFAYDAGGRPVTVSGPDGAVSHLAYDHGDLESVTDALGRTSSVFTNAAGQVVAVTDPQGAQSRYRYDAFNRLTEIVDPLGGVTALSYDANANLVSVTDPRGGVTGFTYDSADRVSALTDPLGAQEAYVHDAAGNLVAATDRQGRHSAFTYDLLGRLTSAAYGASSGGGPYASEATYSYDATGRLSQIEDTDGPTITLAYDDHDRLTAETVDGRTVSYTYDAAGRRTGMTATGASPVSYDYDAAGRLTAITQGSTEVPISYDAAGRPATVTLPGGVEATYSYDAASQVTEIAYSRAGEPLGELTYRYTAAGQVAAVGGSLARVALPGPLAAATYDAANRLTNWDGTSLSYDATGNMTAEGGRSYTWDARGRLTGITDAGGTVATFAYDALGRRTARTVGAQTTAYVHDEATPILELSAGGTVAAELLTGLGLDNFLARTHSGVQHTFLTDVLGSTNALVAPDGTLTEYTYTPFGASAGSATDNPFQFTGRENDGTGLHYHRARYYHPAYGRFISEDPLGLAAGDSNLYAYALGDPVNLTDPTGEAALAGCAAGAAIGVGAQLLLGGNKPTLGGLAGAAAGGCLLGMAPFALGFMMRGTPWALNWAARGLAIERRLGGNLPRAFPTIDRWSKGVATSIKSVDLRAASYANSSRLSSTLKGYVDKVAAFQGARHGGVTIRGAEIQQRALTVAVPRGTATAAQQAVLRDVISYGRQMGVVVRVVGVR